MATPGTEAGSSGTVHHEGIFHRLYTGTGAFDIVGKRKRWYVIIGGFFLICLLSIGLKGFNLGIDFEGGTKIQMPAVSTQGPIATRQVETAFQHALGRPAETVQIVGAGASQSIQIKSTALTVDEVAKVKRGLFTELQPMGAGGQPSEQVISDSAVSGTWGGEITRQALIALGVFLVLVTAFLAFYFERLMAVSALVALVHDVLVTAGVYSLVGFEVTPSTVIGLLTILGFSLYDTVVVFDKVKENTRGLLGLNRRTYGEAANLAVNQTLMRSINTSVVALLPVLGLLAIGAGLLGVGVLRDLALVQLTGILAGVFSSIFLATPLLVDLKMRDPKYRTHTANVLKKRRDRKSESTGVSEAAGAETTSNGRPAERELAASSSAPARTGKGPESRRPSRPSGKSGRSGKRRR